MRDFAVAGLGLAVLPLFIVASDLREGRLVHVLSDAAPVPDTIYVVYPPTRHVPARVRALVDYLSQRLSEGSNWQYPVTPPGPA